MSDSYPHKLDPVYWQRLRGCAPEDVVVRSQCDYLESSGYYEIGFLGSVIWVDPLQERFLSPRGAVIEIRMEGALAILVYLVEAKNIPLGGHLVSAKDLKGGEMFFRGPHSFPVASLQQAFGEEREGFLAVGKKCAGIPGTFGDASFQVMVLPRIPVQVLLWLSDEDFPAQISFLFDATIEQHLPLDVIFGLVCELCFCLENPRGQ